jgi:hypothetical protein
MTYRELAERIHQMTDSQKDCHVTYQHDDEYFGKLHLDFTDVRTEDRLDGWHPYLTQFDKAEEQMNDFNWVGSRYHY